MDALATARAKLAAIIAAGRPRMRRVRVLCRNGVSRWVHRLGSPPSASHLKVLDAQAAQLGLEIKRLELARGPLQPRLAPRIAQIPPALRGQRQASTPRTGRWGFGLTPAYQGRRSAHPEKLEEAREWTQTSLDEVIVPALVLEAPGTPQRYSLGFAPKKTRRISRARASQTQMREWAEEQANLNAAEKRRKED